MSLWFPLGLLSAAAGCSLFQLATPHQHWLARTLPARPARLGGTLLLGVALALLAQIMQLLVALFTLVTWAMLVWTLLPHLDALVAHRRRPPP